MHGGFQDQQMAYAGQMLAYQQGSHPRSQKEQDRLEKRELRAKMMQKKAFQELTYDESNVKCIMVTCAFNTLLLLVCVAGNAWKWRAFRGFGMKALYIKTDMTGITVQFECGKNWLEDKVCNFLGKLNGRHSLQEFTHLSCTMGQTPCDTMNTIYYASFIIFITFTLAILLQLGGLLFLHFYWYTVPLSKVRKWSLFFMTGGPCLALLGLGLWAFVTPDLAELPRGWVTLMSSFTGNSVLSYHVLNNIQYGWSFVLAIVGVLTMTAQVVLWPCMFKAHWREDQADQEEQNDEELLKEELLRGEEEFDSYGSVQPQADTYGHRHLQHQATAYVQQSFQPQAWTGGPSQP